MARSSPLVLSDGTEARPGHVGDLRVRALSQVRGERQITVLAALGVGRGDAV